MRCSNGRGRAAGLAAAMGIAASVLIASRPAFADRLLTLDEALSLARAHNRDLRAARARLDQSAAGVDQVWASLLPQVSAQGKYTHNNKEVALDLGQELNAGVVGLAEGIKSTSTNPAEIAAINQYEQKLSAAASQPIVIQKGNQLNGMITATVPLFVPSVYSEWSAAKSRHRADQANFSVTEATVLLAVAETYFAAAGEDQLVTARQNAVTVARQTLDRAKQKFDAGAATNVDAMRAGVALVRAEQAEAEAEDTRDQAYRSLSTLLGTHESLHAAPATDLPPVPLASAVLAEGALHLRPEVDFYRRSIDAADSSARAARFRWAPTLSAFGSAQAMNYQGFSGDKYFWAVGVQLDWTLYDGGLRDAQRRRALAEQAEYEQRLDLLRDTVIDEVTNRRRALATARRALDSASREADLSRETLRLVRVQYESGRATQLDLLEAQDSLAEAEVAVVQARFALSLSDLQLQRASGRFPETRQTPGNQQTPATP